MTDKQVIFDVARKIRNCETTNSRDAQRLREAGIDVHPVLFRISKGMAIVSDAMRLEELASVMEPHARS